MRRRRPARPWASRSAGDLRIGRRLARRNLPQRLPDALLERGAADVEGQVEAEARRLHEADDPRDQVLVVPSPPIRRALGKAILKIAHERVGVVADQDRHHALVARGDEDRAERAIGRRRT